MIGLVRRAWLVLVLTLVWVPITGYAQGNTGNEPLRVRLMHQRVVTGEDCGERYVPAKHAKPGDPRSTTHCVDLRCNTRRAGEDGAGPHAYQTDGATDRGRHPDALIASLRTGV